MNQKAKKTITAALLLFGTVAMSGCIGINTNEDIFFKPIQTGMPEGEVLRNYGAPSYAGFADDDKIYIYKIRNNKYIILVGLYEGYDLVVTCEGGEVKQVDRVQRPKTFSLFQPLPWAEGIE